MISPGKRLRIHCAGCPVWFDWIVPAPPIRWEQCIPSFHSKSCKRRRQSRNHDSLVYTPCPRPEKMLYRTLDEAQADARKISLAQQRLLSTYRCICGGLHNGNLEYRELKPLEAK